MRSFPTIKFSCFFFKFTPVFTDHRLLFRSLPSAISSVNPLSANPKKWSNKLKQFIGKLSMNCLSVFGNFVGLTLKELNYYFLILKPSMQKSRYYQYFQENLCQLILCQIVLLWNPASNRNWKYLKLDFYWAIDFLIYWYQVIFYQQAILVYSHAIYNAILIF